MTEYHEWIERHLQPRRWRGAEAEIHCPLPGHDDRSASATANAEKGVWFCHVCNPKGRDGKLRGLAEVLKVDPPEGPERDGRNRSEEAETVYPYRNAEGAEVFEVVRRSSSRSKALFRHTAADGKVVWKQPKTAAGLIYRLPEVLAAAEAGQVVCIAEGEKDCESLGDLGYAATTNAGGAGKWRLSHARRIPTSAPVVLFYDADNPGVRHALDVFDSLRKAGHRSVHVVEAKQLGFEVVPKGGRDITDWLSDDPSRGKAEVQALIDRAIAADLWDPQLAEAADKERMEARSVDAFEDDGRAVVVCERGERERWTRETIAALIAAGEKDDLRSLYDAKTTAAESLEQSPLTAILTVARPDDRKGINIPQGTLLMAGGAGVGPEELQAHIDSHIRWARPVLDKRGNRVAVKDDPTGQNARSILARYRVDSNHYDLPRFRLLAGITDSPTLREDGSLLTERGYDPRSALYANIDSDTWRHHLKENPTREDAAQALEVLYELVSESKLKESFDKAVWVSFLLSVLARDYAQGNVPLFGFTANAPGAGKGTLVDLACIVATGRGASKWSPVSGSRRQDSDDEERKRMMTVCVSGLRVLCIDNVKPAHPVGSPALDAVLTAGGNYEMGVYEDRLLGTEKRVSATWRTVVCVTGNNLTVVGDLGRRTVLCSLHHDTDPQGARYARPDPHTHARKHRARYLGAALTVLTAHRRAVEAIGGDDNDAGKARALRAGLYLQPVPSFGGWSNRIRSAVAWADREGHDPWKGHGVAEAQAEPERKEALEILRCLHGVFGPLAWTSSQVKQRLAGGEALMDPGEREAVKDLEAALENVSLVDKGKLNAQRLGRWLLKELARPGEYVLHQERTSSSGVPSKWLVEKGTPPAADVPKTPEERARPLLQAASNLPTIGGMPDATEELRSLSQKLLGAIDLKEDHRQGKLDGLKKTFDYLTSSKKADRTCHKCGADYVYPATCQACEIECDCDECKGEGEKGWITDPNWPAEGSSRVRVSFAMRPSDLNSEEYLSSLEDKTVACHKCGKHYTWPGPCEPCKEPEGTCSVCDEILGAGPGPRCKCERDRQFTQEGK